jgi:hypothetical protein
VHFRMALGNPAPRAGAISVETQSAARLMMSTMPARPLEDLNAHKSPAIRPPSSLSPSRLPFPLG